MKQIRVELAKWVDGQGFSYEADIDSYEISDNDWETVETYINSPRWLEDPECEAMEIQDGEDYEIRIYTDGVLTDAAWLSWEEQDA